jgi:hypothetical protein
LVAETVLNSAADGITEGTVVAVLPSVSASVGESSTGSIPDDTTAVAHTSASTGVFTTTLEVASALGTLTGLSEELQWETGHAEVMVNSDSFNRSLSELRCGKSGNNEGNEYGDGSHVFIRFNYRLI